MPTVTARVRLTPDDHVDASVHMSDDGTAELTLTVGNVTLRLFDPDPRRLARLAGDVWDMVSRQLRA